MSICGYERTDGRTQIVIIVQTQGSCIFCISRILFLSTVCLYTVWFSEKAAGATNEDIEKVPLSVAMLQSGLFVYMVRIRIIHYQFRYLFSKGYMI